MFSGYFNKQINPAQVVAIKACPTHKTWDDIKYYPEGFTVISDWILFKTIKTLPPGYYTTYGRKSSEREFNRMEPAKLQVFMANSDECLGYSERNSPLLTGVQYRGDMGIHYDSDEAMWEDARKLQEVVDSSIKICQYKP